MFLFEGSFGNILHTGDCRLTPECLRNLPEKYLGKKGKEPRCPLDYVFLDCTFGKSSLRMPSKHSAIRQVINCIWKHPDAPVVHLSCELLGLEEILVHVYRTFGSKIYVDKGKSPECFQALMFTVPEILSCDPSSRFHLFEGFFRLYEIAEEKIAEALADSLPEPLIIRPSTQWYARIEELSEVENRRKPRFNEAVRDQFGVWHVCYSIHSSREELEWALQLLAPKRVVSTTTNCRAVELDYVKKHFVDTKVASDDPLWKLLEINMEASVSDKGEGHCPVVDVPPLISAESHMQLMKTPRSCKEKLGLSPLHKTLPITLFGRARLGLHKLFTPCEETIATIKDKPSHVATNNTMGRELQSQENDVKAQCEKSSKNDIGVAVEVQCEKSVEKETAVYKGASCSVLGSSKSFNEGLRKLYRSMNVPVPQPLPSLVELMNSNKRAKRRFQSFTSF